MKHTWLVVVGMMACGSPSTSPEQLVSFAENRCLANDMLPTSTPPDGLATLPAGHTSAPDAIDVFVSLDGDNVLVRGRPVRDLAQALDTVPSSTVVLVAKPDVDAARVATAYETAVPRADHVYIVGWASETLPDAIADLGSAERRAAVMREVSTLPPPERDAAMEAAVRADLAGCSQMMAWFDTWTDGYACGQLEQLKTASEGCEADFSLLTFAFPPPWPTGTRPMVFLQPTGPLPTEGTWAQAAASVR